MLRNEGVPRRIFTALTECYGREICPCRLTRFPYVARVRSRRRGRRQDRPSRASEEGNRRGREGGALPSFWRVSVRGGGRLGWLEGVPFQTLRIDLLVDGTPSLHPVLVVVDHVLKLFQRSFYRGNRSGRRDGFERLGIDEGWL